MAFNLIVNGQPVSLALPVTITELLASQQITNTKGMALAVNNTVVARTEWEHFQLSESDDVFIIRAVQGG